MANPKENFQQNPEGQSKFHNDLYQRVKEIDLKDVANNIIIPDNPPELYLMTTPCRSGSTVQLQVFGASEIPAQQHPAKAVLRNLMHGERWQYQVPEVPKLFVKETVGPYTEIESRFNALDMFLQAGYPKEKIHPIFFIREPLACATSWHEQFSPKRGRDKIFANFVESYKTVGEIRNFAQAQGLPVTDYLYESLRDNHPATVVQNLFDKIGTEFKPTSVSGWSALPAFGTFESRISYSKEPLIYHGAFHDVAENADSLQFFPKKAASIDRHISQPEFQEIQKKGLYEIYEDMRRASEDDLGLRIKPATSAEEYRQRHQ